jgi:4-diphosphocytidyl-2-C-methyl-D-erythritol kinase
VITLEACAKINLTLEVLGKRTDGYHEIRSVMQTISLCDKLVFEDAQCLNFQCVVPNWVAEKSLVSRAARLLMHRAGVQRGAKIVLDKRIPLSSGLGGDSSDAAAVLRGLARLWSTGAQSSDLINLASTLGADMPFFFNGGTALAQGRGDIIKTLPEMPRAWLVLLFPDVPKLTSKTATMYSMLNHEHLTQGEYTDALALRLSHGATITSEDLSNVFEKVALTAFSGLEHYWTKFQQAAGVPVHLAGAGPTIFALFNNESQAICVQQCLQNAGMNACLATTCGPVV